MKAIRFRFRPVHDIWQSLGDEGVSMVGYKTFRDRGPAEAAVQEVGLGSAPDRVTYTRQKDGRIKPVIHVEHYADAEYVRDTYGFDCRPDA